LLDRCLRRIAQTIDRSRTIEFAVRGVSAARSTIHADERVGAYGLVCTAYLVDEAANPPAAMTALPLFKKTKTARRVGGAHRGDSVAEERVPEQALMIAEEAGLDRRRRRVQ
jgi:hypothetical protein